MCDPIAEFFKFGNKSSDSNADENFVTCSTARCARNLTIILQLFMPLTGETIIDIGAIFLVVPEKKQY